MSQPVGGVEDAFVARSMQSGKKADTVLDLIMGVRRPFELIIDSTGIAVRGRRGVAATWDEIADVYVLTMGRTRYLVYQLTREAASAMGRDGTAHPGRWHVPSLLWAPQPAVDLSLLDQDEHRVLGAVERFTGGVLPTAERIFVNGRRDMLRTAMHGTGERWAPRDR